MPADPAQARRLWQLLEPVHAVAYFAPEVREAMTEVGLLGFWMGYFAGRAAPMGAVGPDVVTATFYGFHPAMPARALPDAWALATPAAVLEARLAAVDLALRRVLGDAAGSPAVAEAAGLARRAIEGADVAGRPLFAGHAGLPWPDEPHLVLWHAATLVREHRGDGHIAVLVGAGVDGCMSHVLAVAAGAVPRDRLQPSRGWSDGDWAEAEARLAGADLVELRARIERRTDELAAEPWSRLDAGETARLDELLLPLASRIMGAGEVPVPNPIGLPWPPREVQPANR